MTPSRGAIEDAALALNEANVNAYGLDNPTALARAALTAAYARDFPQPNKSDEELWRDLCEKDDRTSPTEYPDMALITFAEFAAIRAEATLAERERCARIAKDGCRVPPDGGSPTEAEREMCDWIAAAIRKGE